jgi:DNA repair exonuclease SbcCD ATPase subunit
MKYCCEKCETEFSRKSSYDKHMNRKSPCVLEDKKQFDLNKRTCPYCEELYSTVRSAKVHMTTCRKKPSEDQLIEIQKNNFVDIITQLSEKLDNQNNELNDMKNKLLNNDEKINNQNNELKDLKSKLSKNNNKIDKQTDKIKDMNSKLSTSNSKIVKQSNKLNNLKSKQSNELEGIKNELSNNNGKIDNHHEEIQDLKNKISTTNKNKEKAIEMKPKKKAIPKMLKNKVWDKHIGIDIGQTKCLCCKITNISQLNFHCGHILSEKDGGELTMENLKPICGACNSSMGTMNMDEFILKYKF